MEEIKRNTTEQYGEVSAFVKQIRATEPEMLKKLLLIAFTEGAGYQNDIDLLVSRDLDENFNQWCQIMFNLKRLKLSLP